MKAFIIISIIVLAFGYAYFFPKNVKILGFPAEMFFGKKKNEDEEN
ncbi:hypothetical protein C8N46_103322 [Kordia periserrulae]|uniref:Uncharacterized protein n=1 Tax=Kordia periserrulae TaxID=701523 RepID=A0A2T6C1N5_9FLAO|nr:hypothetical protein [Kordia periserrulae]PTX62223.1 hypothetical protein C8N46_103322 [Kordia periserrulae]